ncbi:MAG: hypothetical protein RHS_6091 [Robinsoniella sp. RHS]|nr:MAG: hypothetical protein RHS_6091 [Robinsoniella sp. RHS]
MFETIKRIYHNTSNAEVVEKAFQKGWITKVEKETILAA